MRNKIQRKVIIRYKNERERNQRVSDLLERGYEVLKEGIEHVGYDNERGYAIGAVRPRLQERYDHTAKYVVMRMTDARYDELKRLKGL